MKKIYVVDEEFIRNNAYLGNTISDEQFAARANECGCVYSNPSEFQFDCNDNEGPRPGLWEMRVIDLDGDSDERVNDRYDRPIYFVPTNRVQRGMAESAIAMFAKRYGYVYDNFDEFVIAFNNGTAPEPYYYYMEIGSMTVDSMESILSTLRDENADKFDVQLTNDQIDTICDILLTHSAQLNRCDYGINAEISDSIQQYRHRILGIINVLSERV